MGELRADGSAVEVFTWRGQGSLNRFGDEDGKVRAAIKPSPDPNLLRNIFTSYARRITRRCSGGDPENTTSLRFPDGERRTIGEARATAVGEICELRGFAKQATQGKYGSIDRDRRTRDGCRGGLGRSGAALRQWPKHHEQGRDKQAQQHRARFIIRNRGLLPTCEPGSAGELR